MSLFLPISSPFAPLQSLPPSQSHSGCAQGHRGSLRRKAVKLPYPSWALSYVLLWLGTWPLGHSPTANSASTPNLPSTLILPGLSYLSSSPAAVLGVNR